METGLSSTHATPGEGTITRAIARTENLVRLFQVDHTIEVLRALPPSDTRRGPLLKFWIAQREQLARALNLSAVRCTGDGCCIDPRCKDHGVAPWNAAASALEVLGMCEHGVPLRQLSETPGQCVHGVNLTHGCRNCDYNRQCEACEE